MEHDENWMSAMMSAIAKLQNKYKAEGMGSSEAFKLAADIVAEEQGIESGSTLLSMCGKISARMKQANDDDAPPACDKKGGVLNRYKAWCAANNSTATDAELAFWSGYTTAAFSYARGTLRKDGYEFERMKRGRGWRIVNRPPEPEPEPEPKPTQGGLPGLENKFMSLPDDKRKLFHETIKALLDALSD